LSLATRSTALAGPFRIIRDKKATDLNGSLSTGPIRELDLAILINVTFHVIGLGMIHSKGVQILSVVKNHRQFLSMFALVMSVTSILVTVLHGLEAGIWAAAFRTLGALPDNKSAILYSLGALTTFGDSDLFLAARWELMGALEALNGVILFGLTTAFLYGMIQQVWLVEVEERRR
jgi:hypothetical protein